MSRRRKLSDTEFEHLRRERIADLRASIAYFQSANKEERERHVVSDLLKNLGTRFRRNEIVSVPKRQEPPDVRFRAAGFEVKEIMDEGRRRHADMKAQLAIVERAETDEDLFPLTSFSPVDITVGQLLDEVTALGGRVSVAAC
jgi:hypothetical protein